MSDYEGEWDPVDLNKNEIIPSAVQHGLSSSIAPKGRSFTELNQNCSGRVPRSPRKSKRSFPQEYRPTLQSIRPFIRSGAGASHANYHRNCIEESLDVRVLRLDSYHRYTKQKGNPDLEYELMHIYKDFYGALQGQDNITPAQVARNKLAQICVTSEAFIEVPPPDSNKFKIWGTEEQVHQAKLMLKAWEMHVKGPGRNDKTNGWTKNKAFDGREEHRLMRDALQQHEEDTFQKYADDYLICPFEAYLIWPDGYDLEQYLAEFESQALEQIGRQFMCRITHEKVSNRITKVAGENESNVLAVYDRLICLLKEMVARKKRGVKLNQCQLPSAQIFKDEVTLFKANFSGHSGDTLDVPHLIGKDLPLVEIDMWNQLRTQILERYNKATKTALRSCLSSLHVSEKHVRMRITFGKLGLTKYKRPQNGQTNYSIDEFVTMVQHQDVEMQQCPLSVGCNPGDFARFTSFIDEIGAIEQFDKPTYAWAIHFDFQGPSSTNTLRLETEFEPSYISDDETEKHTTRWLNYVADTSHDVEELLTINSMGFGRVGYQIHVGAVNIFTKNKILKDLRSFADNVQYTPSQEGLKSAPRRRAIFPLGNRELRVVKEVSIARYPFKDTDGTFEVRRIDIFPQFVGEARPFPIRTEWHASYYYKEWDTLLSEFAYIKLGEDVSFNRDLHTFFPCTSDPDYPKILPQGYKNFMREVEEIQDLLNTAIERTSRLNVQSTDRTSE